MNQYPSSPGFKEPTTSMQAALSIASHAKTVRAAVLAQYVAAYPSGLTPDQVASIINESILTVRPRCAELKRLGMIKATADTRPNSASGHHARVMCATPKALDGGAL